MKIKTSECCREVTAASSDAPLKTPFTKNLIVGYNDGPTWGALCCGGCLREYRYGIIDSDAQAVKRVFALQPLSSGSIDNAASLLEGLTRVTWPVALSGWHGEGIARNVEQALASPWEPSQVVAWVGYGRVILSSRMLDAPEDRDRARDALRSTWPAFTYEWFSFLGLDPLADKDAEWTYA